MVSVIVFLLPLLGPEVVVSDILSIVEPQLALESLGVATDDETVFGLIGGGGGDAAAGYDKKVAERSIQNFASKTASIRDKAREALVEVGPAVRKRLEEVVAGDPRRAKEAEKALAQLGSSAMDSAHRKEMLQLLAIPLAADRRLTKAVPGVKKATQSQSHFVRRAAIDVLPQLDKTASPGATAPVLPVLTSALEALREATREIVKFVLQYGNMSPRYAYVANVGKIGEREQGVAVIYQGLYQPEVLKRGHETSKDISWERKDLSGLTAFNSKDAHIVLLDGNSLLILPTDNSHFPVEDFLANVSAGKKSLGKSKRWRLFLETQKGGPGIRGLAITDKVLMAEIHEAVRDEPNVPEEVKVAVLGLQWLELGSNPTGEGNCALESRASSRKRRM